MPVLARSPLTRLPDGLDGSRYFHWNGYIIEHERRTWSERGREAGRHHDPPSPLYWWSVYNHIARRRSMLDGRPASFLEKMSEKPQPSGRDFDTLKAAREWCDAHTREGWERPI